MNSQNIILSCILLVVLYYYVKSICGGGKSRLREKFNSENKGEENRKYSYGALLRDIPLVNEEAKKFMSVKPQKFKDTAGFSLEMPKQFNGIEAWKDYLSPITDQGECGNCWAHSSANCLADRFAILSLGSVKFVPSPYDLTICGGYMFTDIENQWKNIQELELIDNYFHGRIANPHRKIQTAACEGADLYTTANILYTEGVSDINCIPSIFTKKGLSYDINSVKPGESSTLPYCYKVQGIEFDTCADGKTALRKYRAKTAYNVGDAVNDTLDELEMAMMHEIYRNGPIVSGFTIYGDFQNINVYNPKTDIYQHTQKDSEKLGNHAIRIVGWGEEEVNGVLVPYWWVANSWGTKWGVNGYFKFKRKMRECAMEVNAMAMLPDFPGMVIVDENIVPIESDDEKKIREFTQHYLDPTSGFYSTAIEKIKNCQLTGKVIPYIGEGDRFPDYRDFFAAEISRFTSLFPRDTSEKKQLASCNKLADGSSSSTSGGSDKASISTSQNTQVKQTDSVVCFRKDSKFNRFLQFISTKYYILEIVFTLLFIVGAVYLWRLTNTVFCIDCVRQEVPPLQLGGIGSINSTIDVGIPLSSHESSQQPISPLSPLSPLSPKI